MSFARRFAITLVLLTAACHDPGTAPVNRARYSVRADSATPGDTLPPPPDTLPPPPDTIPPDTIPPDTTSPDSSRVVRVDVTPAVAQVAPGDSLGFFANLYGRGRKPLSGRPLAWQISDPRVARIQGAFGQSVVVRALRRGTTRITATSEGRRGVAIIIVRRR